MVRPVASGSVSTTQQWPDHAIVKQEVPFSFAIKVIIAVGLFYFIEGNIAFAFADMHPFVLPIAVSVATLGMGMVLFGLSIAGVRKLKANKNIHKEYVPKALPTREFTRDQIFQYGKLFQILVSSKAAKASIAEQNPLTYLRYYMLPDHVHVEQLGSKSRPRIVTDSFNLEGIYQNAYKGFFPDDVFFAMFSDHIVSEKQGPLEQPVFLELSTNGSSCLKFDAAFRFIMKKEDVDAARIDALLRFMCLCSIRAAFRAFPRRRWKSPAVAKGLLLQVQPMPSESGNSLVWHCNISVFAN